MINLLDDKICIITGASKGIGKATAIIFANSGAKVYALARNLDLMENWIKENSLEKNIFPVGIDIRNTDEIKKFLIDVRKKHGRIDVLVNNAAIEKNERIAMITKASMEEQFSVNVFALIEITQLVSRIMQRNKSGSIINLTSNVAQRGNPGQLVYSATKGAVISITKTAAKELAKDGIRVNAIAPGLTDTGMFQAADSELMQERIGNICMGRLARPEEIGDAILFLASDMSNFISGQVISVDGCTII